MAVRIGVHDEAVNVFGRPARVDQLGGEEVEQGRVRRLRSVRAEVAGGGDEAAAKMVVPDAIDPDTGGQLVVVRPVLLME